MKVILQKDISNLGDAGDIKEVANGYARNFLLPRKLVIIADDSSRKTAEHQKKIIKLKKEKHKKESEKIADSVKGIEIKVVVQVGEEDKLFGSVTAMDIAKQLKEKGFDIDKRKISIAAPIKQLGEHMVSIKLDEGLNADIKVIVDKE